MSTLRLPMPGRCSRWIALKETKRLAVVSTRIRTKMRSSVSLDTVLMLMSRSMIFCSGTIQVYTDPVASCRVLCK